MHLPYDHEDRDLLTAFEKEAYAIENYLFAETVLTKEIGNAFNEDYDCAECFSTYLWETFQRAHAGKPINKHECRVVRDYLLPLVTGSNLNIVHRWYNSVAEFHNTEDYIPQAIQDIPYFREVLLTRVLPDTSTMELIVTEYDNIPNASYLLPILAKHHPHIPRSILVEAVYELHQLAGEIFLDDPIPFSQVPCTL